MISPIPPIGSTVKIFDNGKNTKPMIGILNFKPDGEESEIIIGDAPPRKGNFRYSFSTFHTYDKALNLRISSSTGEYIATHI